MNAAPHLFRFGSFFGFLLPQADASLTRKAMTKQERRSRVQQKRLLMARARKWTTAPLPATLSCSVKLGLLTVAPL